MNTGELISSGLIDMYCMGLASDEEKALVEKHAATSEEVRKEIVSVTEALHLYVAASGKSPSLNLKSKILNAVKHSSATEIDLPPRLTLYSKVNEWSEYLDKNNI